jgi:hypothetical protein
MNLEKQGLGLLEVSLEMIKADSIEVTAVELSDLPAYIADFQQ